MKGVCSRSQSSCRSRISQRHRELELDDSVGDGFACHVEAVSCDGVKALCERQLYPLVQRRSSNRDSTSTATSSVISKGQVIRAWREATIDQVPQLTRTSIITSIHFTCVCNDHILGCDPSERVLHCASIVSITSSPHLNVLHFTTTETSQGH